MTRKEECSLAERIQGGDLEARNLLVEKHCYLARQIACMHRNRGLMIDDMVNEGVIGLIHAADTYDGRTKFSTYAAWWVKQCIKRAIRNTVKPIRWPEHLTALMNKWNQAADRLYRKTGENHTIDQIRNEAGFNDAEMKHVRNALDTCCHATVKSWDELPAGRVNSQSPELPMIEEEEIEKFLEKLDPVEKKIVKMHYGIGDYNARQFAEIGQALGKSTNNVCHIHKRAMEKLKWASGNMSS